MSAYIVTGEFHCPVADRKGPRHRVQTAWARGPEAAAIWAEALGRPVVYAGADPGAWRSAITTHLGGQRREDCLKTYEALAKMSGEPKAVELARTTALLGRAPRSYRAYVRDVVAARGLATERAACTRLDPTHVNAT